MKSIFNEIKFGDAPFKIIDGDRGVNYPKGSDFSDIGDCLFLNARNVTTNGFNFEDCSFITKEKDELLRKGKLKRNDVVLTTRGTVGNVGFYDTHIPHEHIRINSGMVIFRANADEILPKYLYAFLRSDYFMQQVLSLRSGSAQPQLPIRDMRKISIPLPNIPEQEKIVEIIYSLDDKIELNRKMNRTLEEMARALFKAWFVDFEPVHANQENRPSTSASPEIAKLFPAEFQESELGLIPKGWEVKSVGEVLELAYGKALKASDRIEGRFPVYGSNGQVGWHDEFLVKEAGIVVGRKGNPGIIKWVDGRFFPIDTTFYVKSEFDLKFIFHLLENIDLPNLSSDSAVPGLNRNIAYMEKVVMPSARIIETFAELVAGFYKHRSNNIKQNANLEQVRDSLLPRLISGKIKVTPSLRSQKMERT